MSQAYVGNTRVPVTVVKADPCVITQINDNSIQIATGRKKSKHTTKSLQGHFKKSLKKTKNFPRYIKNIEKEKSDEPKLGDKIGVSDVFVEGDTVQVTGVSKGKGFQGVVKRWGFHGSPRSHGHGGVFRTPGSIGQGTDPGRIWKGKKMPGRMGNDTVTVKNLKVVKVDAEKNELHVSGPVPGSNGSLLIIKRTSPKQETNNEN